MVLSRRCAPAAAALFAAPLLLLLLLAALLQAPTADGPCSAAPPPLSGGAAGAAASASTSFAPAFATAHVPAHAAAAPSQQLLAPRLLHAAAPPLLLPRGGAAATTPSAPPSALPRAAPQPLHGITAAPMLLSVREQARRDFEEDARRFRAMAHLPVAAAAPPTHVPPSAREERALRLLVAAGARAMRAASEANRTADSLILRVAAAVSSTPAASDAASRRRLQQMIPSYQPGASYAGVWDGWSSALAPAGSAYHSFRTNNYGNVLLWWCSHGKPTQTQFTTSYYGDTDAAYDIEFWSNNGPDLSSDDPTVGVWSWRHHGNALPDSASHVMSDDYSTDRADYADAYVQYFMRNGPSDPMACSAYSIEDLTVSCATRASAHLPPPCFALTALRAQPFPFCLPAALPADHVLLGADECELQPRVYIVRSGHLLRRCDALHLLDVRRRRADASTHPHGLPAAERHLPWGHLLQRSRHAWVDGPRVHRLLDRYVRRGHVLHVCGRPSDHALDDRHACLDRHLHGTNDELPSGHLLQLARGGYGRSLVLALLAG